MPPSNSQCVPLVQLFKGSVAGEGEGLEAVALRGPVEGGRSKS